MDPDTIFAALPFIPSVTTCGDITYIATTVSDNPLPSFISFDDSTLLFTIKKLYTMPLLSSYSLKLTGTSGTVSSFIAFTVTITDPSKSSSTNSEDSETIS